jgi:hypothetical protein
LNFSHSPIPQVTKKRCLPTKKVDWPISFEKWKTPKKYTTQSNAMGIYEIS